MRLRGLKKEFFDKLPENQQAQIIAFINIVVVTAASISAIILR